MATKEESPTPICRCRVIYLGSSVPHVTKDGLQGIQKPLSELYPENGVIGGKGIDSWLSIWSNGLLLENVDENGKKVTRFFPIKTLHYCGAVRYVNVPGETTSRFLPLDSPFARNPSIHPPIFACILRRTTGIKVLECHAFCCKRESPANALVRCCFHAYADNLILRSRMGDGDSSPQTQSIVGSMQVDSIEKVEEWRADIGDGADEISIYNGDENHKVWAGPALRETVDYSTMRSGKSSIYGEGRSPRPRQMVMPSLPPPPVVDTAKKKKDKKGLLEAPRPVSALNGAVPNGTLMRNGVVAPSMRPRLKAPPGYRVVGPPRSQRPPSRPRMMRPVMVAPPPFLPPLPHDPYYASHYDMLVRPPRAIEEPIYMPSARPLSPIASYKPTNFPYEDYYATAGRGHKKMDHDSLYNIYKKKSHLNEKAFSYSIRQEDRSRSYGSLANLKFTEETREDHMKEREMIQMAHDLNLSTDFNAHSMPRKGGKGRRHRH